MIVYDIKKTNETLLSLSNETDTSRLGKNKLNHVDVLEVLSDLATIQDLTCYLGYTLTILVGAPIIQYGYPICVSPCYRQTLWFPHIYKHVCLH